MQPRTLHRLLAGAFAAALALPTIQKNVSLVTETTLGGVEAKIDRPRWTWPAWFAGSLQETVEGRYRQRFPFRAHAVKTWNQLHYAVFGARPAAAGGTQIVIGKDNMLYELPYIASYNEPDKHREQSLRDLAARVRQAQDALAARGIAFLLVISPSKAEIYPESIPDALRRPDRAARASTYDRLLPLLRAQGVHLLDTHAQFLAWKRELPHPLFAKGGTHWNYYAAAKVVDLAMDQLEAQAGRPFPDLEVTAVATDDRPEGTDDDLFRTLNLWGSFSLRTRARMTGGELHPALRLDVAPGARKPNLLVVGDSFSLTLNEVMDRAGLCADRDTLYYFKRILRGTEAGRPSAGEPMDAAKFDVEAALKGRDAVIVEINEQQIGKLGFGFIEALLAARPAPAPAP